VSYTKKEPEVAIQKIELEIDIPDKFEFIRVGPRDSRVEGEFAHQYIRANGIEYAVFVRKAWQWPEWLLADWIAMNRSGKWFAYADKPKRTDFWYFTGERLLSLTDNPAVAFEPPPCNDWKKSARQNPRLSK